MQTLFLPDRSNASTEPDFPIRSTSLSGKRKGGRILGFFLRYHCRCADYMEEWSRKDLQTVFSTKYPGIYYRCCCYLDFTNNHGSVIRASVNGSLGRCGQIENWLSSSHLMPVIVVLKPAMLLCRNQVLPILGESWICQELGLCLIISLKHMFRCAHLCNMDLARLWSHFSLSHIFVSHPVGFGIPL